MQLYRFPRRTPIAARLPMLQPMLPAILGMGLGTVLAASVSSPALARPDSLSMTCAAAANLVAREGAVVLGTGPNLFDRYVSSVGYCSGFEQLKPEWIKTRDNPKCFVGYTCYVPTRDNFPR